MAKNSVQDGRYLTITAPTALTSGVAAIIENMFVIPLNTVQAGEEVTVTAEEVWELPKAAGTTGNALQRVYWDATNDVVTTTVGSNRLIGCLTEPAVNGATLCKVRLNGLAV